MGRFEDFLRLAENDAKVALIILNSANDELMQNSAAYNIEQSVEKIMKGLLVKHGGVAGTSHNITQLSRDLDELNIPYPKWINEWDDVITSWSTTIRYNANFKADHDDIELIIHLTNEWIDTLR